VTTDVVAGRRAVRIAAGAAFVGILASGPLGLLIVARTHPQPAWRDAETFARAYHAVQALPYYCGFLLVAGMVGIVASLHTLAAPRERSRSTAAVACVGAFAAMIVTNYAIQTAFVPATVSPWLPTSAPVLAALTMANPRSLGWALEMWGYAVPGAATWLIAPVVRETFKTTAGRIASVLFMMNGPASIASAVLTALIPGWVLSAAGVGAFVVWNVLVLAMTLLLAIAGSSRAAGRDLRAQAVNHLPGVTL
jgi:hypothetical protein